MPEFFVVEGKIPVALGVRQFDVPAALVPASWGAMGYSMAWDTDPPRPYDHASARRAGDMLEEPEFWRKVAEVRSRSSSNKT